MKIARMLFLCVVLNIDVRTAGTT